MKKTIVSALVLGSAYLYGMEVLANEHSNHTVGIDLLKTNFSFVKGYGKGVFGKNLNQFSLFGQYNLRNNLFLEYGYGYMTSKRKNDLQAGEFYPGDTADPLPYMYKFNSKITQQFSYLGMGWNYNIPKLSNTYISLLAGLAGLSVVRVNGWFEVPGTQLTPVAPAQRVANSRRSFSKTMPSVILKAAVNHKFTDHWGIRLSGVWQKLDHFKLNSKPIGAEIRLKNCTSVGLGMFYNI